MKRIDCLEKALLQRGLSRTMKEIGDYSESSVFGGKKEEMKLV